MVFPVFLVHPLSVAAFRNNLQRSYLYFLLTCRSDVQSHGRDDELLHTAGSTAAAAGRHGSERLQHGPVPTGANPPADARGPHEPIW